MALTDDILCASYGIVLRTMFLILEDVILLLLRIVDTSAFYGLTARRPMLILLRLNDLYSRRVYR